MAKKKFKCECPAGEKWAVPFADFLSLLLALFIALYALASVNKEKQKALKEEFVKIYDFPTLREILEKSESEQTATTDDPTSEAEEGKQKNIQEIDQDKPSIEQQIEKLEDIYKEKGNLDVIKDGMLMEIPADLLFKLGDATIANNESYKFIQKVANIISLLPEETVITVKGYALNSEVTSLLSPYKDALDLSSARANNVIRELIKLKIPKHRLIASSFAFNEAGVARVEFELMGKKDQSDDSMNIDGVFDNKEGRN